MTKEQVRLSWGEPKDVKRTVLSGKTTEQWIYGKGWYGTIRDRNLYFENGILESIKQR